MTKRKSISKKLRFEVFKRDKFTCQYCGRKAPDVILEVDHIEPVSKGGTNEITNLITSCRDCNRGKSDRKLNDKSVVKKEQKETELLAERREQIDEYFKWQKELLNQDMLIATKLADLISKKWGFEVTDAGVANLNKWLKKYGLNTMMKAANKSFSEYADSEKAFKMLPRIAYYQLHPLTQWEKEFYYLRGILEKRCWRNDNYLFKTIRPCFQPGYWPTEESRKEWVQSIFNLAKTCRNWTDFRQHFEVNSDRGDLPDEPID